MASLYQRLFIVIILLISFAGRIAVYAMPAPALAKVIIKKDNSSDAEKPESSAKPDQLEEKVKLSDLLLSVVTNYNFSDLNISKGDLSGDDFTLTYCHLKVPQQPPK